jgi:predicted MPP superfamily phosphohydrolase
MTDILGIGDLHFPFHHKGAVKELTARIASKKFDLIIQVGDLLDQYGFSRFAKQNIMVPHRELQYGRELALTFWDTIHTLQPTAKKVQLLGNHDIRIIKRVQEALPEAQELVISSLLELYQFDNVETVSDPRKEYIVKHPTLGKIAFLHGYRSKIGDHTKFMHMNTVHGHRHRGEVTIIPILGKLLFELDCGYLADPKKEPLAYSEQRTNNWSHGWGEIDIYGSRFIPLNL